MAALAQRLPVGRIPKQGHVATVWCDVVCDLGQPIAVHAERVLGAIEARGIEPTARLVQAPYLGVSLAVLVHALGLGVRGASWCIGHQLTASRMRTEVGRASGHAMQRCAGKAFLFDERVQQRSDVASQAMRNELLRCDRLWDC